MALGILTGTTLALAGLPGSSLSALLGTPAASSTDTQAVVSQVSNPSPAENYRPVAYVQPIVHTESEAAAPIAPVAPIQRAAVSERAHKQQIAPSKIRSISNEPIHPMAPAETRPSRHVAHPLTKPARTVLASVPVVLPVAIDSAQMTIAEGAKPSLFYTEGDITVADYDPAGKTIETSDGRTFVIGATVRESNATPWQDYRSDVHYRCDQSGSCTLMRPGAIALNARLI
ncbi:MAG: hypothetical protein WBC92_11860 [Terracidiphilus sp.]